MRILLVEMNKEGKTIIVASHDDLIINQAHRVFTMEDGKITSEKKLKDPPKIQDSPIPENYLPCQNCERYLPPGTKSCGFCGAIQLAKE